MSDLGRPPPPYDGAADVMKVAPAGNKAWRRPPPIPKHPWLPGWPLLMDQATARQFTSTTRAQFQALLTAGLLPPPRELLPGHRWWHRDELVACLSRLFQLENTRHDEERHGAAAAKAALADFDPSAAGLRQDRRQGRR